MKTKTKTTNRTFKDRIQDQDGVIECYDDLCNRKTYKIQVLNKIICCLLAILFAAVLYGIAESNENGALRTQIERFEMIAKGKKVGP